MLLATAKDLDPYGGSSSVSGSLSYGAAIPWDVGHLVKASDALRHAAEAVGAGARQAAVVPLVAGVFIGRVVAMHMAYLKVGIEVDHAYPHSMTGEMRGRIAGATWTFGKWLEDLESGDAARVFKGVDAVVGDRQTRYDYSQFVDEMQEAMEAHHRFLRWLDIAQLAWLLLEVWTIPVAGAGGSPAPPTLEGMPARAGGGAAVAVASADALAAIRRLVDIGAIAEPALVHALGGRTGAIAAPPAPALATTGPPLPTAEEADFVNEYTEALAEYRKKIDIRKRMEQGGGRKVDSPCEGG